MDGAVVSDALPVEVADVLVFPVGGERHAILLSSVREVVAPSPVAPIPGSPPWLLGLVNLRGDVVSVIDSARALSNDEIGAVEHLVMADSAGGPVGIAAAGTPTPARLGERAGVGDHEGSSGCYLVADGVVTLLDLDGMTEQR